MILIHAVTGNYQQAQDIAAYWLSEKLVVDALISTASKMVCDGNGQITKQPHYLITGKTKALLFDSIDKQLRKKYPLNLPEIYSVPIVHMDWEQASSLKERTAKT